ncbi:putative anaerobic dehydrogenase TorD [Glaesserella parasuis 84-15995]|nr:putative anaerobic dehydrogenase TorD [Glaesserella parasuis 84-15995]
MNQTTINDFSLLCRLFGNLFYRSPTDPILAGTFAWLKQGNLRQTWALTTDEQSEAALTTVEKKC